MGEAQQDQAQQQREQAQREQQERERAQQDQARQASQQSSGAPQAEPSAAQLQERAEKAQQDRSQALQKQRDEAEYEFRHPRMMGKTGASVVPANAPPGSAQPGPTAMTWAVGAPIFARYGVYYEEVGKAEGGVLAVELGRSEPKTVYLMRAPDSYEEPPEA